MIGVVVGVDGSDGSKVAVDEAALQASYRKVPLTVVATWQIPTSLGLSMMAPPDGKPYDAFEQAAKTILQESMDHVASKFPDIEVKGELVEEAPAPALCRLSKDADLLVLGSRGHGGFTGLLLGSVSTYAIHHAQCPVLVMRQHKS